MHNQMMYKAGGPTKVDGDMFSTLIIEVERIDAEEEHAAEKQKELLEGAIEEAEADGWRKTTAEALEVEKEEPKGEPTRDELEQKAKELEIPFNEDTPDETLSRKIAIAVGGKSDEEE